MPEPVDEGGQEFDQGLEPGAADGDLETPPVGGDGTPPDGTVEPTEEPWRAAIGESIAGLTAEVRQALSDMSKQTNSRYDEMSRRPQQPQPTPRRPEPPTHEFDDPLNLLEAGADRKLVDYFQTREKRVMDVLNEIKGRQDTFEQTSMRRRQGDEMAAHFDNEMSRAIKSQPEMSGDTDALLPIITPLIMGQALTTRDGNPRSVDVPASVKSIETYVQARIKREIDKRTEAGQLQAGTPAPPPPGQGTRPALRDVEIKSMDDVDKMIDNFAARWPDGPPEL